MLVTSWVHIITLGDEDMQVSVNGIYHTFELQVQRFNIWKANAVMYANKQL